MVDRSINQFCYSAFPKKETQSAANKLHSEICTTLTLGQSRGASVCEQAWDILHEILEASSGPEFEKACELLLAIRNEKDKGFEGMCTFGTELH